MQRPISSENPVSLKFDGFDYPYVIRLEETDEGIFFVYLQYEDWGDDHTKFASHLRFWSYGVSGRLSYRRNHACSNSKTLVPKYVQKRDWPFAWTWSENPNWGIRGSRGVGGRCSWEKSDLRPQITGIVPRAKRDVDLYTHVTIEADKTEYEPFRSFWKRYGPEMRTWLEEDAVCSRPSPIFC